MAVNTTSSFNPEPVLYPVPPLIPGISDQHLSVLLPVVCHWLFSAFFEIFEQTGFLSQYRLHTSAEELTKNRVTRWECLRVTIQCQILQTLLGLGLGSLGDGDFMGSEDYDLAVMISRVHAVFAGIPSFLSFTGIDFKTLATTLSKSELFQSVAGRPEFEIRNIEIQVGNLLYWYIVPFLQIITALIVADACMYFLHRLGHTNKWIYKHIHSQHHRLYVPYAWGGSYNHPVDSLVVDGLSYAIGSSVANLTNRQSMILFVYSTFKNVTDHCGFVFPWNPILSVTGTDASFHDVHHQSWGLKTNFGAHLSIWDRMLGTYFSDEEEIARLRVRNRIAAEELMARKEGGKEQTKEQ